MFRKLSLALAVSAALSPISVYALGLGDIVTKSALNESFQAEIQLLDVGPGEVDGVKAELASPLDFARANLERPFLLTKLRFQPVERDDGSHVLLVTTRDPVREPFLNFLVEVNWPKGRLLREFTVLLDPPVTTGRRPPPIRASSVPVRERIPDSEPEPEPEPIIAAMPQQPELEPVAVLPLTGDFEEYGPVPRGATLWGIAKELAPAGASIEQVAMALFRANPRAFLRYDINALQAGVYLRVPDSSAILSTPSRQARADFLQQVRRGPDPSAAAYLRTAPARLRIATPAEIEDKPEPAAPEGVAETGGEIEQVKTDLMMVRETSESTRQETEDLRTRIRELEAQLSDIRQLLKLKSDQLAQIQGGQTTEPPVPEQRAVEAPITEEPIAPAPPEIEIQDQVTADVAPVIEEPVETVPVEVGMPSEEDALLAEDEEVIIEDEPGEESGIIELTEEPVSEEALAPEPATPTTPEVSIAEEPAPTAPPPAPQTQVKPEPQATGLASLMSGLRGFLDDPKMLAAGGGGTILVLGLGWWLLRRRRSAEDEFQESALLAPADASTVELDEDQVEVPGGRGESTDETSFISDFSPSDIDALQEETGEVDPAAEADVYIAYGRYQQAESLIAQALEKSPDRGDLKHKLLEIYFTTRNVSAFTGLAAQMQADGSDLSDPQMWSRVRSMGRELAPDNELFGGESELDTSSGGTEQTGAVSDISEEDMLSDSQVLANLDLDLDMDTEMSDMPDESMAGVSDLSATAQGQVLEPPPPVQEKPEPSPLADTLDSSTPLPGEDSDFSFELDKMDLRDLDADSDHVVVDADDSEDSLQLPDEEVEVQPVAEPQDEEEVPVISLAELEDNVLPLGEDALTDAEAQPDDDERPLAEIMDDMGSREEEVETKLDLARAYVEMGDAEGAREILEEVLEDGSDQQKTAAQAVMGQLG